MPHPPCSGCAVFNRYLTISFRSSSLKDMLETYDPMTRPGKRNIGPPYSPGQCPSSACRCL